MNVSAERVRAQIVSILTSWGMDADLVATTAEVMVATDLVGVDSHGVSMLMTYDDFRDKGKLNLHAHPRVIQETRVAALIDAQDGIGHPAAVMGMNLAIDKASQSGVAVVSVINSHHFGAAGYYAAMAPKRGMIGMVTSSTRTISVVPTHGSVPVLGTNPFAFAAPAGRNRPFLLDMATSTTAANKVKVYHLNGKKLPEGWMLDEHGESIRDATVGMDYIFNRDEGGLTPIGGTAEMASYKGYGLGVMVHILGGILAGASFSPIRKRTQKPGDPDKLGHFFLAINPALFRPLGAFENDLDDVMDILHATPPVDPAKPVLVAGDPEASTRERRLREGIPIPPLLADKIRKICEHRGVPFLLEPMPA